MLDVLLFRAAHLSELEVGTDISIGFRGNVIRIEVTGPRFTGIIPIATAKEEHQNRPPYATDPNNHHHTKL